MKSTNLTPLEALHRRKIRLEVKQDVLLEDLTDKFNFLQKNIVPLATESAMETMISGISSLTFRGIVKYIINKGRRVYQK